MIRDIEVKNIDEGFLNATIDDTTLPWLRIKEIIKKPTQIYNNQDMNTSLYDVLNINMFLAVTNITSTTHLPHSDNPNDNFSDVTTDIEQSIDIENNNYTGMVDVPIYDSNMNIIGYEQTPSINNPYQSTDYIGVENGIVHITINNNIKTYIDANINVYNGIIQSKIQHNLPLGEYTLTVKYNGNKYYQPCIYTINFSVTKRLVEYIFDTDKYENYPNNPIYIHFKLIDSINKYPIQSNITYTFNNQEYNTNTNKDGECFINITVPSVDESKCIQENIDTSIYSHSYPLIIQINSDNYKLNNDIIRTIYALKIPTEISIRSNIDNDTNTTIFEGDIIGITDVVTNVQYGDVMLSFDETDTYHPTQIIDKNGHFSLPIDLSQVSLPVANHPTEDEYQLDISTEKDTKITIDLNNTEYNVGDELYCTAQVEVNISAVYQPLTEGMVIFYIFNNDNKLVYQHACEVNDSGEAEMIFELSTTGTYKIMANYYGMFEYSSNSSEEINYIVGE